MKLSYYERRELSEIERALSRDRTLSVVANLFAEPTSTSPTAATQISSPLLNWRLPQKRRTVGGRRRVLVVLLSSLMAMVGMVGAAIAAVLGPPVLAAVGIVVAVVAGIVLTVETMGGSDAPSTQSSNALLQQ